MSEWWAIFCWREDAADGIVERSRGECAPCGEWHAVGSWPSHDNSGGPCLNGVAASSPFGTLAKASHRVRRGMSHRLTVHEMPLCQNKQIDDLKKLTKQKKKQPLQLIE